MRIRTLALFAGILTSTLAQATPSNCGVNFRTIINESPPLYFHDTSKKDEGVTIDIIEELKKRTGCNFTLTPMNHSRAVQMLGYSLYDLAILNPKNAAYDKVAKFIPLDHSNRIFAYRKTKDSPPLTIDDLFVNPKFKFVILPASRIFLTDEEAQKLEQQQRFISAINLRQLFEKVKTIPNAVTVGHYMTIGYYLDEDPNFLQLEDKGHMYELGAYYVPHKGQEKAIALITKALQDMEKDGSWKIIATKPRPTIK